jgi:hypothetical protein
MGLDRRNEMEQEDEIRLIAYSIWEEEGCLDGHHIEHWIQAEEIWKKKQVPVALPEESNSGSKQAVKPSEKTKSAGINRGTK